jgi:hypothetical protein
MRRILVAALLFSSGGIALADSTAPKKAAPKADAPKEPKVKKYDFGGLDVEGRLKTPQLLYFLNRMKSEFDDTSVGKKSFMPELKRSVEEM